MLATVPLESSFFDTDWGLPLHPLVVHAAVVLLPLAATGLILEVFVPALRRRYAGITLLGLVAGVGSAFLAKESGEGLARLQGLPKTHALWGSVLPPVALALLLVSVVWYFLLLRRKGSDGGAAGTGVLRLSSVVTVLLAVAVLVFSVLAGHSGAESVWKAADAPAAASAQPTPSAPVALTMAVVQEHATESSCWSVVSGDVYDLTPWFPKHPGGPQFIVGMCGKDATESFAAEHGSDARAKSLLAGFKLGPLVG